MTHHHLAHLVSTMVAAAPVLLAGTRLQATSAIHLGSRLIVAKAAATREALRLADLYAPALVPVVIAGPTGSGKTLLAEYLHARSGRPGLLVAVTGAEIAGTLGESELFGHVRGAFTDARRDRAGLVAQACGGTLFLDDLQCMPLEMQAKLLRVLDRGHFRPVGSSRDVPVQCRIVVGLGDHPDTLAESGKLLVDLRGRVGECLLQTVALVARREEIADLAAEFLRRSPEATGVAGPARFGPGVVAVLEAAAWPRNVRQLEGTVYRAYLHAQDADVVTLDHLPAPLNAPPRFTRHGDATMNRLAIHYALAVSGGQQRRAAALVGVDRNTIRCYARDLG